jgi:hypothetical protein
MEWVLQVADEIDDAIAMLRHGWLGAHVHIGKLAGGGNGFSGRCKLQRAPLPSSGAALATYAAKSFNISG